MPTKQPVPSVRLPSPDLSERPHAFTVERGMRASPDAIFRAWTERFDSWFARPGALRMRAQLDEPFYFEVDHEGARHAHYGRFLALEPGRLVEMTWMTGKGGTDGAETVVRVELAATGEGAHLRLTHSGFHDEAAAAQHEAAWPRVLAHLDGRSATPA